MSSRNAKTHTHTHKRQFIYRILDKAPKILDKYPTLSNKIPLVFNKCSNEYLLDMKNETSNIKKQQVWIKKFYLLLRERH